VFGQEQQAIDLICRSSGPLLNFVDELLDLARIDAGRMETEKSTFDLRGMLHEVTDPMRLAALENGRDLTLDLSSDFPLFAHCDRAKLRQTLIKLVDSAIQLNAHGSITVRAGTGQDPARPRQFCIEVENHGAGIELSDGENIFEPFMQLGPREPIGSGLGLVVSQRLVQLMGGHISVQSAPGKGTLYRVELPLESPLEQARYPDSSENGSAVGLAPDQQVQRILIVEPQIENSRLLAEILDFSGLQVPIAPNGEQGVAMFSQWQPHLILMTVQMPVMDGIEATQQIRSLANGNTVKIVGVAACTSQETNHYTPTAAGMDSFVCKPYQVEEIYGALKTHLGVRFLYQGTGSR
jgi:CheY-like chemotaxis protein